MFVGMGVSAVFPVLDGLLTFGIEAMEKQIGLSWLVLQGVLYIAGAALYAVSWLSWLCNALSNNDRPAFRNPGTLASSIRWGAPTRYFMCSLSWRQCLT